MGAPSTSKKTKNNQKALPAVLQAKASAMKKNVTQTRNGKNVGKNGKTKIVVKCNCGFTNCLFLRGEGIPGLSWDRGIQMKCTKADEWVWETDKPFTTAQFKVLLNDKQYETGENHTLCQGKQCSIKPNF